MKILSNIDLGNNQLLNAKLQNLGADLTPGAGNLSVVYYNTATNVVKVSNGTTVDNLTNVLESIGTGTANGLSVSAISGKNINVSLALASGAAAGALSSAFFNLLNGATNLATGSTLVERDASGNFSAGTITATLTGTASNSSQLNNQAASFYLSRTNHTGTQLAATISDFDTQVNTHTINQLTAPTADFSMNTHKITNLVDPINPQDASTKAYVDSVATGLDVKASVRFASTANIAGTYTAAGGTSARGQLTAMPNTAVDGVTPVAGNRVLLKNQTSAAQNGIWVVSTVGTGANGVWDRATDFDQDVEVTGGAFMFIEEGTANADTGWVLTTNNPITIGGASGTALTFAQFSSAGSFTQGNGINISAGAISAVVDTTAVNANSLSLSSTGITISTAYVGQSSITTLGTITTGTWSGTAIAINKGGTGQTTAAAGLAALGGTTKFAVLLSTSTTSYTVTHNLGSLDVIAYVVEVATGAIVYPDIINATINTCTINFATAPTSNAYRAVVIG